MRFARPDTTHEPAAPETEQVAPPGEAVMVCEAAAAPLDARATVTVADRSPATALGAAGVFGMRAPEVITRFARSLETATNTPFPYVTMIHGLSAADAREFQVIPSVLIITRLPAPVLATATNTPFP